MSKCDKDHNSVSELANYKFPVGSQAFHPVYRICKVIAAEGAMRVISAPALGAVNLEIVSHRVHVNELQSLP